MATEEELAKLSEMDNELKEVECWYAFYSLNLLTGLLVSQVRSPAGANSEGSRDFSRDLTPNRRC